MQHRLKHGNTFDCSFSKFESALLVGDMLDSCTLHSNNIMANRSKEK